MATTHTFGGYTYTNGYVPTAVLAPIQGQPPTWTAYLRRDAAAAWNAARAAVLRETGIVLILRGWNRTRAEQERFFRERYRSGAHSPYGDYRTWPRELGGDGKVWGRVTGAPAAVPGTSNHGWALAGDIDDYGGVGQFDYPRRVRTFPILARYGWTDTEGRRPDTREPWHVVFKPAAVQIPAPTEADDMFTTTDRTTLGQILTTLRAVAADTEETRRDVNWLIQRTGGSIAKDDDGKRTDPPISTDLNELRRYASATARTSRANAEALATQREALAQQAATLEGLRKQLADLRTQGAS